MRDNVLLDEHNAAEFSRWGLSLALATGCIDQSKVVAWHVRESRLYIAAGIVYRGTLSAR